MDGKWFVRTLLALSTAVGMSRSAAGETVAAKRDLERERYLVVVGSCNNCRTPHPPEKRPARCRKASGWQPSGISGTVEHHPTCQPEARGPGHVGKGMDDPRPQPLRPSMPWFTLRDMSEADLRARIGTSAAWGPKEGRRRLTLRPAKRQRRLTSS